MDTQHVKTMHHPKDSSIKAAARKAGLNYGTVLTRIKRGWSLKKALSTPLTSHSPLRYVVRERTQELNMPVKDFSSVQEVVDTQDPAISVPHTLTAALAITKLS